MCHTQIFVARAVAQVVTIYKISILENLKKSTEQCNNHFKKVSHILIIIIAINLIIKIEAEFKKIQHHGAHSLRKPTEQVPSICAN